MLSDLSSIPAELHAPPYSEAPALYNFNVPRYFSMQFRAREFAKQKNVQLTWCYAKDVPLHPGDRELTQEALEAKLFSWLRRHDQQTSHIPSLFALARGMPIRLTESVDSFFGSWGLRAHQYDHHSYLRTYVLEVTCLLLISRYLACSILLVRC